MKTEANKNKSRYTHEFKDSMVKLVAESDEPISKIAIDVGINKKTDRGSQYASKEHRDLLTKHGIRQSMSRKGNCWDNAVFSYFENRTHLPS